MFYTCSLHLPPLSLLKQFVFVQVQPCPISNFFHFPHTVWFQRLPALHCEDEIFYFLAVSVAVTFAFLCTGKFYVKMSDISVGPSLTDVFLLVRTLFFTLWKAIALYWLDNFTYSTTSHFLLSYHIYSYISSLKNPIYSPIGFLISEVQRDEEKKTNVCILKMFEVIYAHVNVFASPGGRRLMCLYTSSVSSLLFHRFASPPLGGHTADICKKRAPPQRQTVFPPTSSVLPSGSREKLMRMSLPV